MIRKFNYTGRRKIAKSRIVVNRVEQTGGLAFNARLNIADLGFPPEAKVYVEPYYKTSFMRFDFGTVSKIVHPADTSLSAIPVTDLVLFRVKVVDETGEQGLILGKVDGVILSNAEEETNRSSILHVNFTELGEEIWKVTFNEGANDYPILEVNVGIPNIRDMVKTDKNFISLVYPAAIREVLRELVRLENFDKEGDEWTAKWLQFCEQVLRVYNTPSNSEDNDAIEEWINSVTESFCRVNQIRKLYTS